MASEGARVGQMARSPSLKRVWSRGHRPAEEQIRHKVQKLAALGLPPQEVHRQLAVQKIYIADVRRYWPAEIPA